MYDWSSAAHSHAGIERGFDAGMLHVFEGMRELRLGRARLVFPTSLPPVLLWPFKRPGAIDEAMDRDPSIHRIDDRGCFADARGSR